MSAVSSWTTWTQFFIQVQSILSHVVRNIVGDLDKKPNKEQNRMAEEDIKNNIILDSGSSNNLFINPQLVTDTKIIN